MNTLFRGRVGNMIYYVRNGVTCARRMPIKERGESTPKQKESETRFSFIQSYYSYYCKTVSPEIWRKAAKLEGRTGPNLFNSTNSKYINNDGEIADYEHFMFSQGAQLLPRNIKAEKDGLQVRLSWEEDRNWTTAAATDRLCVGVLCSSTPRRIYWIEAVTGVRGDMSGEFTLPNTQQAEVHVYCFFMRADGEAFSESHHVKM